MSETTEIAAISAVIVTLVFGTITAIFSYFAYRFSKERFRLELLAKRWEIYEETLKFCSMVVKYGGIPKYSDDPERNDSVIKGIQSAEQSFRGIGFHKTRSLFGPDIDKKFDQINRSYAWLLTFRDVPIDERTGGTWYEHVMTIYDSMIELPNLFKPYVYFGDYKK